jgi:phosphatidylglycerophosphatase A
VNPILRLVATGVGTGHAPVASGTAGSALALAVYLLLPPLSIPAWLLLLLALLVVAVPAATAGEAEWGHDPSPVVIDEIAGFFVTMAFLPQSALMGLCGFFVFRAFDIAKPPPARQAEALPGGWGVVADDVAAGIYGNLFLRGGMALAGALGF